MNERDVGRGFCELDVCPEGLFSDACHDARGNVVEAVGGVGVVQQDERERRASAARTVALTHISDSSPPLTMRGPNLAYSGPVWPRGTGRCGQQEVCVDEEFANLFKKPPESRPGAAWEDVAHELEALGKTLGEAVQALWQRQENRERARELEDSLKTMAQQVNRAIEESVTMPEAQQAREQFSRVTESVRVAVETTTQELRPEVLSVLRQMNADLRRLAGSGK